MECLKTYPVLMSGGINIYSDGYCVKFNMVVTVLYTVECKKG